MTPLTGRLLGVCAGFVFAWSRLSDPAVIREMLLLRDAHVFLRMGSAVVVAIGVHGLKGDDRRRQTRRPADRDGFDAPPQTSGGLATAETNRRVGAGRRALT
jgi:hypothetical protein